LYLGTEHGVYVSFDNGAQWQSLRLDLPVTPVHGIVVEENDLVIGTHGRGFYMLDNISVLRQLSPELSTASVHLFEPPRALRRMQASASMDYYLKDAADKVTIRIVDASGRDVRVFEGVPDKDKKEGAGDQVEEESPFRQAPPRVETKAGLNRFLWDMRQRPAREFKGLILWAGSVRGPLVLPGTYEVQLTAGVQTKSQRLVIEKDPRQPKLSDADLQAQYSLASQINQKVNDANAAVERIRHLKTQAQSRAEKAKHAKLTSAVETFATNLTAIEGEIYQHRNQSNQDPLNYPIRLNNKLAALQGTVELGDGAPTKQALEVFAELSQRLATQLSALDALVSKELPPINRLVTSRKLEPIKDEIPPEKPPSPTPTSLDEESDR
jgi:hypothetical protein